MVHVVHKVTEVRKEGISFVGIKVGRAVGVGIPGHGKCMGDKVVDASYEKMVGNPFHHGYAFAPPIGSEDFGHGAAFLFGVNVG